MNRPDWVHRRGGVNTLFFVFLDAQTGLCESVHTQGGERS